MSEIFLFISLAGFFLFFKQVRKDLHPSFYPALTVSAISVITCMGGIMGILFWVARALFIFGLLSLVFFGMVYIRKNIRKARTEEAWPFLWMMGSFLFFSLCLAFLLRNRFIYHYDDFSHWARVAKILLEELRLPISTDELMFPSYPPGTASFIFFCGAALGTGSNACLLGQSIMLISFLISLQSAAGEKKIGYIVTTILLSVFVTYNIPLDSLAVDNLLGAAFMSAMLLFLWRGTSKRFLPDIAMVLSCCVMIKNSGAFLAFAMVTLLLIQQMKSKKKVEGIMLWLAFPFLVFFAWRIHLNANFNDFGKHYMSLYVYYGTFRQRLGEIGLIMRVVLPLLINPLRNHALILIPAFALVYGVFSEQRTEIKNVLFICGVLLVLYETGVLVMYICSMGVGEVLAQNGADYARYNGTLITVLSGILIFMVCSLYSKSSLFLSGRKRISLLAALTLLAGCISLNIYPMQKLEECKEEYRDAYAFSLQTKKKKFTENQELVVQYNQTNVSDYEMYMAHYYLYPARHIRTYSVDEEVPDFGKNVLYIDLRI